MLQVCWKSIKADQIVASARQITCPFFLAAHATFRTTLPPWPAHFFVSCCLLDLSATVRQIFIPTNFGTESVHLLCWPQSIPECKSNLQAMHSIPVRSIQEYGVVPGTFGISNTLTQGSQTAENSYIHIHISHAMSASPFSHLILWVRERPLAKANPCPCQSPALEVPALGVGGPSASDPV